MKSSSRDFYPFASLEFETFRKQIDFWEDSDGIHKIAVIEDNSPRSRLKNDWKYVKNWNDYTNVLVFLCFISVLI